MCTKGAGQGPGDPDKEGPQGLSRTGVGDGERAGEEKVDRKNPRKRTKGCTDGK